VEASTLTSTGTEHDRLRAVRAALHGRFDGNVGAQLVERELEEAIRRFDGARVRDFVPVLVERRAGERLLAAAHAPREQPVTVPLQEDAAPARGASRRSRRRSSRWVDDVHWAPGSVG
jgi:hypothetical protein